jgi:RNA polymerase sigma-70 factor (ECF subfamily)
MTVQKDEVFIDLLTRNKDRLFRICKSYTYSIDEAKDLYQEVLLNIWKSLNAFKGESGIDTWVFRICLNICLRAKEYSVKKETHLVRLDSIHYQNIPEQKCENKEAQIQALYHCISMLEGTDKSIILLYLEDQSYKEIATIVGLSENHVAVKIKRIKNKLLTCLKP